MARSRVAEELKTEDIAAVENMTPAERLALADELGREGIDMYMRAYNVDYETASRALKKASQAGRHYSRCMDDNAW